MIKPVCNVSGDENMKLIDLDTGGVGYKDRVDEQIQWHAHFHYYLPHSYSI